MSKKKRNSLNPEHSPKSRREFIDYDYADKLDDESLDFLKKFTDEFYGGSFVINDTYIIVNGDFIQITGNSDNSKNVDLRKKEFRNLVKYYKDSSGNLTDNPEFKYNNALHKDNDDKRELWKTNKKRLRDVTSSGFVRDNADNTLHLDILSKLEAIGPESLDIIWNDLKNALNILDIQHSPEMDVEGFISLTLSLNDKKLEELRDLVSDII